MDNWDNWFFLLLNLVFSIPLIILGIIFESSIRAVYERSVFSSRQKRIKTLIGHYKTMKKYSENPTLATPSLILFIAAMLLMIAGLIVTVVVLVLYSYEKLEFSKLIYIAGLGAGNLYLIILMLLLSGIKTLVWKISRFDSFKQKTVAKLIKLGGNPEELDRIDKEFEEEEVKKPVRTRRG